MKRMAIIGAGRVGKTLGKLFTKHKVALVTGVVNRSLSSAEQAVAFIGAGVAVEKISDLPVADIYLVTTVDDALVSCFNELFSADRIKENNIIVHCSGALTSSVFQKAKTKSAYVASIHPLKSFADSDVSCETFAGTFAAFEGDVAAEQVLVPLFTAIGAQVFRIETANKILYHAASVMASNYLVTLFSMAKETYRAAGLDEKIASQVALSLFKSGVANLEAEPEHDVKKVLTGPLNRGDVEIIKAHLAALEGSPYRDVYRSLAKLTLSLTDLDVETLRAMEECLV